MEDEAQLLARHKLDLRNLLGEMDKVNPKEALSLLDHYVRSHEANAYQERDRLARQVHDVLASFHLDRRILQLTENEIPDAKDRLDHVMQVTEQSAQKVIDAIENSMPMVAGLQEDAEKLMEKWQTFSRREMHVDQFRVLCRENDTFLRSAHGAADKLKAYLTDMLLAQEFQDITGQVIRRVIQLVRNIESQLIELVRMISGKREATALAAEEKRLSQVLPDMARQADRVNNQEDIDDLLSSLGL